MRRFPLLAAGLAALLVLGACGDDDALSPPSPSDRVAAVVIVPDTVRLRVGFLTAVPAAALDETGTPVAGVAPLWTSADSTIARVGAATGVVLGRAPGETTLTASVGDFSDQVVVVVDNDPVAVVDIEPDTVTLLAGYQHQYTARTFGSLGEELTGQPLAWSIGDASVATISQLGIATGVTAGETVVVARSSVAADTVVLRVVADPAAEVRINTDSAEVRIGYTKQFSDSVFDANGLALEGRVSAWATGDPTVAVINSATGEATGISEGVTTVIAQVEEVADTIPLVVSPPAVDSVAVLPDSAEVRVGFQRPYTVLAYDSLGAQLQGRSASWTTGDPGIATVDAAGTVSAVSVGETSVTATVEGVSDAAIVGVSADRVFSVTVTPDTARVRDGFEVSLQAETADSVGTVLDRPVTWTSLNPAVASVESATGVVRGETVGEARIVATSEAVADTAVVQVLVDPVQSVNVSPARAEATVGQTVTYSATTPDSAGVDLRRPVSWSVDDPSVAIVNDLGQVTALGPGETLVRAESEGAVGSATFVASAVPVASVVVAPDSQEVRTGYVKSFTAQALDADGNPLSRIPLWSTSDPAVASVAEASVGEVRGEAVGAVDVVATVEGVSGTARIGVTRNPVRTVTIASGDRTEVVDNFSVQLSAQAVDSLDFPLLDREITWSSLDAGVATVDAATGEVTPVAEGTTSIIAQADGEAGTVVADTTELVVVSDPVARVEVTPASVTLNVGPGWEQGFSAAAFDAADNALDDRIVTWSSTDGAVATVDASGEVSGVAAGTAEIIATIEGVADTAQVTVQPAPVATVAFSVPVKTIQPGETPVLGTTTLITQSDAQGNDLSSRPLTWSSGDPSVVAVTDAASGAVEAVSPGRAVITATSPDGPVANLLVVVPTRLVVSINRAGGSDIYVANQDGSNLVNITNSGEGNTNASISPDGQRIVFQSTRGSGGRSQIFEMDFPDGANVTQLTSFGGDTAAVTPTYSPDGTEIAFLIQADGGDLQNLYTMDRDGSNPSRLVSFLGKPEAPSYSPDGSTITFAFRAATSIGSLAALNIYTIPTSGGTVTPITATTSGRNTSPVYSADGSQIYFASDRVSCGGGGSFAIWSMAASGDAGGSICPVALTGLEQGAFQSKLSLSSDDSSLAFVGLNINGSGTFDVGIFEIGQVASTFRYVVFDGAVGSVDWEPEPGS